MMTSAKYVLSIAVLSLSATSSAAPFAKWFSHTLTDGRTVRIWGEGDEYAAHFEDEDGRTLIYNPEIGNYEYGEEPDAETQREMALARMREKAEETGLAERWAALKENTSSRGDAEAQGSESADAEKDVGGPLKAPPSHTTSGTIVGITLLVDFPMLDADGNETNTLAAAAHPNVTANDLDQLINGDDFTKYGNASSVRGYYAKATSGHVDYTNAVIGWIKAPHTRGYYDDARTSNGTCGRRLIGDILDALVADPRYETEFRPALEKATANSSGEILALNVLFAGEEASTWSYGLWAHQYVLTSTQYKKCYVTIGGKKCHFYSYQISPVTSSPTIHTFCHESGHMICDFPDLYAYSSGLGNGVGMWCIMSGRVVGGDTTPPNFCAYLRAAAGWVTPKTLPSESGWVTVKADLQDVWKFPHPTDKKQYYLIENRQASGTDALIQGSGIVIYRCDESGDNTTGAKTTKSIFSEYGYATNRLSYEVSVEQADGLYEIERDDSTKITLNGETRRKYNGDPDDSWFEGNGAALYAGQFNALSTPCARWTNGSAASINLSAFSANGETMSFYVTADDPTEDEGGGQTMDISSDIYVNGLNTRTQMTRQSEDAATYWRLTDGRIVLRGQGPYLIQGTGSTPIRCAPASDYKQCNITISNLWIKTQDESYSAIDCGSKPVVLTLKGTNTVTSFPSENTATSVKCRPAIGVESGNSLVIKAASTLDTLQCTSGKFAAGIGGGCKMTATKKLFSSAYTTNFTDNTSGSVRILGGTVVATGGYGGAGIGSGAGGIAYGSIGISNSVVNAKGGTGGAGIGGGLNGKGGFISTTTGSVTAFDTYDSVIQATGGAGAAGIGGGDGAYCGYKLRFHYTTVYANGGAYGAGIGGGNGGAGYRVDALKGSLIRAIGGTDAAGIGGGKGGASGSFFNYDATVWATGSGGDGSTVADIGCGSGGPTATSDLSRFYVAGGSTTLANGYVRGMKSPSNATERVYRTIIGGLTPHERYVFDGISDYAQTRIVADANGEVHLWLPNNSYSLTTDVDGDKTTFTATVSGGKTTASGTSEYGRWLKRYSFINTELPTAAERRRFETTSAGRAFVKRGGDGREMTVWDEYVAGTDPDEENSVLRSMISIDENGKAVVGWEPDLNEGGTKSIRKYTIYGVENLGDEWHPRQDGDRFFKVGVEMRDFKDFCGNGQSMETV